MKGPEVERLKEIARLRSGYTVRRTPKGVATLAYPMIQIRDVADGGSIALNQIRYVELPELNPRFLLRKGDILFCARGSRNLAAVYEGKPAGAVAGSQFFVLGIRTPDVDPHYLAWYISQARAQDHFAEHRTGSHIPTVNKGDLEDLPIPVPPLGTQRKIVELAALAAQERELMAECMEKRKEWLAGCCLKAATGP